MNNLLKDLGINYLLVNSTNEYLVEYSALSENARYTLTGFSGSTGDALLTEDNIYLFVDGRYHTQADNEAKEGVNVIMMYPFMTLNDDTEITHSEMKADGKVKVYIETPDEFGGFHNATCWLPDYKWEDIEGYSDTEMAYFKQLIRNNAHLIIEFSQEGGILNAANS